MSLHSEDWVWGPAAAEEDRRHRIVAGRAVAGRTKCHRVPSLMWTYFAALREGTEMWEVCIYPRRQQQQSHSAFPQSVPELVALYRRVTCFL